MLEHDSVFFFGVIFFIFIVWAFTGGPSHPLSFAGPLLSGPGALGGGTYLSLPKAPALGNSNVGQSHASPRGGSSQSAYDANQQRQQAEQVAAFGPVSPYRGQVTLGHSVSTSGTSAANEYVELYASSNASGPINISGWRLVSDVSGNGGTIPQGTEVPISGTINAAQPIRLNPGDQALVESGSSPIGASFRENKCIGYFGQFQTFSPSLQNDCPYPPDELKNFYGGNLARDPACSDYVARVNRCVAPLSPPVNLSSTCQNFIVNDLTYNGCLSNHQSDYDFKSATWRIYLGQSSPIWRTSREVVKLLDATGKTVDSFSY